MKNFLWLILAVLFTTLITIPGFSKATECSGGSRHFTFNNWTGAISTAWENPNNWSSGTVADGNADVFVTSGTVIVNSNAVCRKLTILPGVIFRVNTGFTLTITGTSVVADSHLGFNGKTAVFMGNSITKGVFASDNAHRWTSLFCSAKGAVEDNHGVSGQTMQVNTNPTCTGISSFDRTTIPAYNSTIHSSLFISLGINDVGLNYGIYTPAAFKADYTAAINHAITIKGWPANKIVLINVYKPLSWNVYSTIANCTISVPADAARVALYNTKVAEVASENGCLLVDIYSAMNGLTSNYFNSDQLHPIDLGHAFITNYLLGVL